jgi:hypothetical protein
MTQVHSEPDGRVRWVASWTDPGLPNWLDCSGRNLHLLVFRFFRTEASPTRPRLRPVPLASLGQHFHADTPRVSPEARRALLMRRLESVYRRRTGDF